MFHLRHLFFGFVLQDEPDEFGQVLSDSFNLFVQVKDSPDTAPKWQKYPTLYEMNEGIEKVCIDSFKLKHPIMYFIAS